MATLLGLHAWAGNEMVEYLQGEKVDLLKKTPNVGRGVGGGRGDVLQAQSADAALLFLALSTGLSPKKAVERALRLYQLPYQMSWVEREIEGHREPVSLDDMSGAGVEFSSSKLFGQFLSTHIHAYRRASLENDSELARLPVNLRHFYMQKRPLFAEIALLRHVSAVGVVWSGQATMVLPSNFFRPDEEDADDDIEPVLHHFAVEYRGIEERPAELLDQFKMKDSMSWNGAWLVKAAEMLGPLTPETAAADSDYDLAPDTAVSATVNS